MVFTLMTMGVNRLLLRLLAGAGALVQQIPQPLVVFGRVPLFFHVLHLFVYAGIGTLFAPGGASIPLMCPLWLLGLAVLFPLCLGFGRRQPATALVRML